MATGGGGETPPGSKQGDKGSALPEGESYRWKAGSAAEVGWMVDANHGGGYVYSVCPKSEAISESCFSKHVLPFVGTTHGHPLPRRPARARDSGARRQRRTLPATVGLAG